MYSDAHHMCVYNNNIDMPFDKLLSEKQRTVEYVCDVM